jgi:nicotinamide riboside transporter PnuC
MLSCAIDFIQHHGLEWVGTILTMLGANLVSNQKPKGFYLFLAANAAMVIVYIQAHLWGPTLLTAYYFITDLNGIRVARQRGQL